MTKDPSGKELGSSNYFEVVFPTCNSFRQILQFLNQTHKTIPLVFTKNGLQIRKENDKKNCIFEGCIHSHNLLNYYVDPSILEKDKEHVIYIQIAPLLNYLKKIQKKLEIKILQTKDQPDYLQIFHAESVTKFSKIRLDPCKETPRKFVVTDFRPSCDPNVTMKLSSFNFLTESTGSSSDHKICLTMYDHGLYVTSDTHHGGSGTSEGTCEGNIIAKINIPSETIKSLIKLSSLCEEGISRIYCKDKSHIRLEIPISVIGTISLFLIDEEYIGE